LRDDAEAAGIHTLRIEAPEGRSLPALLAPQLRGRMGRAKSYAERLFDFPTIGPLSVDATKRAIELPAVNEHVVVTAAALDESFFRVRFDRLTPAERRYLRAMAELGPGPHRSGDIAERLTRSVTSLGPTRNNLIAKGMIWSPNHGDTAFTVPLFDAFMRRIMPGDDWSA
jgi:hypothetical protein